MKSVLKYPGAKNRLAPWICEYIPRHDVYLEPFAGSLAVLFNKPRSHIETVNDLDGEVVNFFRIVRDRESELRRAIELTPFSRGEYEAAYGQTEDELENARRFAVKCWMGFGCGNLYRNGFKSGQQKNSPNPARAWTKDGKLYKYFPADKEGDYPNCAWSECPRTPKEAMEKIWNSTIKKSDLNRYGWEANPWVWVIEFKRCEKPEEEK